MDCFWGKVKGFVLVCIFFECLLLFFGFNSEFIVKGDIFMFCGDKSKYSDKQQCKVEYIEESYKVKGVSELEVEVCVWVMVNKQFGGGECKGGFGCVKSEMVKCVDCKDLVYCVVQVCLGRLVNCGLVSCGKC